LLPLEAVGAQAGHGRLEPEHLEEVLAGVELNSLHRKLMLNVFAVS